LDVRTLTRVTLKRVEEEKMNHQNITLLPGARKFNAIKTVAILTNFMDFSPGYSLSGIVVDQIYMLARKGHKVVLYVNEQYNPVNEDDAGLTKIKEKFPDLVSVKKKTKFMHLTDYTSIKDLSEDHKKLAKEASAIYAADFLEENIDTVFTHDFIFTGWNLPYDQCINGVDQIMAKEKERPLWYHWVHSVPSQNRDWWDIKQHGNNHYVVFPNETEIQRVAESFKCNIRQIKIIPHIKDIRNWYDFGDDAMGLTELCPKIMEAQVIQVYPCSTDRLSAKQLSLVIQIFGHIKIFAKVSVFLVIANQWATGRARREDVDKYIDEAESCGLINGKDFVFTSTIADEYAKGISKRMLRELTLLSNIFIFPTKEESFGLVGPEASFAGVLPIMNKSLDMMKEVMGTAAPAFDFGSHHNSTPQIKDPEYIKAIAVAVLNRLYGNEALATKNYVKIKYNMDSVYYRYYLPNM